MMTWRLYRLLFQETLSLKRLLGFDYKKAKVKGILIGVAIVYALAVFFGLFGYMFFDLAEKLQVMSQISLLLEFFFVYFLGLTFMFGFLRADGYLYYYRDHDILAPLPISPRVVFIVKFALMMTLIYLSAFIFTAPILFAYFYHVGFDVIALISVVVTFITFPLVPIMIVSSMTFLISSVTARVFKNRYINILLLFIGFFGVMFWMMSVGDFVADNPLLGQISIIERLAKIYPPLDWGVKAISDQNLVALLGIVLLNVVLFGAFLVIAPPIVHLMNKKGRKTHVDRYKKAMKSREKTVFQSLVLKESSKFFGLPLYAMNAGIGPVMMIVASVGSLFYRSQLADMLADAVESGLPFEGVILGFIGFCVGMAYTPAISLSLEGKQFWLMKSLPIEGRTLMFAKATFNILIALPLALISVMILAFVFGLSPLNTVMMMILISVFSVLTSVVYCIINLHLPKFNFVNEVEVIKQSAAALIAIFGAFGLIGLNGWLFYIFHQSMPMALMFLLLILINMLFSGGAIWYVWKFAERILRKL